MCGCVLVCEQLHFKFVCEVCAPLCTPLFQFVCECVVLVCVSSLDSVTGQFCETNIT